MGEETYSKFSAPARLVDKLEPIGAQRGDFTYVMRVAVMPDGTHVDHIGGMNFVCLGCGTLGTLAFRKPSLWPKQPNDWHWDGNREKPTLSPSIHHVGCWHGHLQRGFFRSQ